MDEGLRKKLNSPDILPPRAYRRNVPIYELVCYVNCFIGCRMSDNHEDAQIFRDRAKRAAGLWITRSRLRAPTAAA
jgi:hypothetical protein